MNYQELEIKILNIDKEQIKKKLLEIGAEFKQSRIQKIYTYDCYSPILMYKLALGDYKITNSKNSLQKIINIISYIKPTFNQEEKEYFKELFGYEEIDKYIEEKIDNIDVSKLEDRKMLKIIEDTGNRFFKWIRLRQDGEIVEITIKYIYSNKANYNIDEVKEIEIKTDNFEMANKLIEEMGYYRKKLAEKQRDSYSYQGMDIEIDEWPLLEPYIEIEGNNIDKIYELANLLGYSKEQTRVMNTEDVYLEKGIDLSKYEEMTFKTQK
ncbi:MAG: hypothetical protein HXK66_05660 [Clostridiales bacterium]|jgi:hypothetical protein|nr:hypothetical protein [Clostridiales bacterium]